jgi:hypothetical protein
MRTGSHDRGFPQHPIRSHLSVQVSFTGNSSDIGSHDAILRPEVSSIIKWPCGQELNYGCCLDRYEVSLERHSQATAHQAVAEKKAQLIIVGV